VPHPEGSIGATLRIHPAVVVIGEFAEPVEAWRGIPQAYECTEFLDFETAVADMERGTSHGTTKANRLWLLNAFAHPMGASTMMPGMGEAHCEIMQRYPKMAVLTAMLHDHTKGRVQPEGDLGLSIDYNLIEEDRHELHFGLKACARLLLAAGAKRAIIPCDPLIEVNRLGQVEAIGRSSLHSGKVDVAAVHPMGSVPMGDNPATAAVDTNGRVRSVEGLWVADGSLFPTSIGVPPQLSIYSMGLHVGRAIVEQE